MARRHFTVDEANKMLPLVRAIVGDLVREYAELCERRDRLALVRQHGESRAPYREELEQMEDQLRADVEKLQQYVDELNELGVELKDFNVGLVDFPALRDGREVYLCWKLDEPEVVCWHELEAGFAGRRPLNEDLVGSSQAPGTN